GVFTYGGSPITGWDPTTAGTFTITYTVTDANGCSDDCTFDIVVNPLPIFTCPAYGPYCAGDQAVTFTETAGVFTYGGSPITGWDPTTAGTFTITYTVTDANGCSDDCTFDIVVHPLPIPDDPADVTVACEYTLPPLTVGEYWTGSGKTGTQMFAGDKITSTTTVYVYAESGTTPNCWAENEFTITITPLTLDVYVYLEGSVIATNGTQNFSVPMRTSLNSKYVLPGQTYTSGFTGTVYSPAGQPYNVAPWNYPGTEGDGYNSFGNPSPGDAGYPTNIVDWVLVSLRDEPVLNFVTFKYEQNTLCRAAALLRNDGKIIFTGDGFECCNIDFSESYYVVIEHRNHLKIMTPQAVPIVNGTLNFDFRYNQSYTQDPLPLFFGDGQKLLPGLTPDTYAMYAGNGQQASPGSLTGIDFVDRIIWEITTGTIGRYRAGDFNMNADCTTTDRNTWEVNNGKFTIVP
ncbi:MAG: hypothetical protein K0B08_11435, partial [Bacteroidales bacterium]|nr:hypothetical protein [Bacteroidales bacterium]